MRAMKVADFVIVALATPFIVLVLSGYVLLAAALIVNLRKRVSLAISGVDRHAPVES